MASHYGDMTPHQPEMTPYVRNVTPYLVIVASYQLNVPPFQHITPVADRPFTHSLKNFHHMPPSLLQHPFQRKAIYPSFLLVPSLTAALARRNRSGAKRGVDVLHKTPAALCAAEYERSKARSGCVARDARSGISGIRSA